MSLKQKVQISFSWHNECILSRLPETAINEQLMPKNKKTGTRKVFMILSIEFIY